MRITAVHTLGPTGTNCEAAAQHWKERTGNGQAEVTLHPTLEAGLAALRASPDGGVLLGCVVYPRLHEIVFQNLDWLTLSDQFLMPTFEMVLAKRPEVTVITSVVTHPAPRSLTRGLDVKVTEASSNSEAGLLCAAGKYDACITTLPAARANSLDIVMDHGPVPMGFTIHEPKPTR